MELKELPSGQSQVLAIISGEGESLSLNGQVKARGNVETWMLQVEQDMIATLRTKSRIALQTYNQTPFTEWVKHHSPQVVVLISSLIWTQKVSSALKGSNIHLALPGLYKS